MYPGLWQGSRICSRGPKGLKGIQGTLVGQLRTAHYMKVLVFVVPGVLEDVPGLSQRFRSPRCSFSNPYGCPKRA